MRLPSTDDWGRPTAPMPKCPQCGDDELGMLHPGYALCYACGWQTWGPELGKRPAMLDTPR